MVPWNVTNHGTRENVYIYDMKHKWKHGADRLCSNLCTLITRIKTRPDSECSHKELLQKNSRKLVLMGDNCPENKSNMVFAFMAELVMRGWYNEIEMLDRLGIRTTTMTLFISCTTTSRATMSVSRLQN